MRTAEEWHHSQLCGNAETYPDEMQTFIHAIQADALEAAARIADGPRTTVEALAAGYNSEPQIAARIRAIKPKLTGDGK